MTLRSSKTLSCSGSLSVTSLNFPITRCNKISGSPVTLCAFECWLRVNAGKVISVLLFIKPSWSIRTVVEGERIKLEQYGGKRRLWALCVLRLAALVVLFRKLVIDPEQEISAWSLQEHLSACTSHSCHWVWAVSQTFGFSSRSPLWAFPPLHRIDAGWRTFHHGNR